MKPTRNRFILLKTILIPASILLVCVSLLCRLDTLTLWSVLPGVTSSKPAQEFNSSLVYLAEHLPEDENTRTTVSSMLMMGAVSYTANAAQKSSTADQVISQYSLGLIRARLLQNQGSLSALQYQLLKIPFQTGNTMLMKRTLPALQRKVNLPDGFMSEEQMKQELNKQKTDQNGD